MADVILGANGKPAKQMNRCIFWGCGKPIPIPAQFCDDGKNSHWRLVPHHLRQAFREECAWLEKRKLPADPHYMKLLECCLNRAIQTKSFEDPEFAKKLEDFLKEENDRARAKGLGIALLPEKKVEIVAAGDNQQPKPGAVLAEVAAMPPREGG